MDFSHRPVCADGFRDILEPLDYDLEMLGHQRVQLSEIVTFSASRHIDLGEDEDRLDVKFYGKRKVRSSNYQIPNAGWKWMWLCSLSNILSDSTNQWFCYP